MNFTRISAGDIPIKIAFLGSYVPRECGIATYTKDLINTMGSQIRPNITSVYVVNNSVQKIKYPAVVKKQIYESDFIGYINTAKQVNRSDLDLIHIQHEFGLFGGESGEYLIEFVKRLNKPLVITFHTVLSKPDLKKMLIVKRLADCAYAVTVMAEEARRRLIEIYSISPEKIVVIPHGVPDIPFGPNLLQKKALGLQNKIVISTFGLISKNKGLEFAISSISSVVKKTKNVALLIIGKTHPNVFREEGDSYRNLLQKLVKQEKLGKYIKFVNRYLTLDELIFYLQATDIYITPYLEPEQITSGTLSYALGAGKACVSTPYAYAQEVLDNNRGILVDFRNSQALGRAILGLILNERRRQRIAKNAFESSRKMLWSSVGETHMKLYEKILNKNDFINKSNDRNPLSRLQFKS